MPATIKLAISVLVALVGIGAYYVEAEIGHASAAWVALALAALMIVAMWIFPEAGTKQDASR